MAQKPGQSGEKGDSNLKSSSSKLRSMIEGSEDIFTVKYDIFVIN